MDAAIFLKNPQKFADFLLKTADFSGKSAKIAKFFRKIVRIHKKSAKTHDFLLFFAKTLDVFFMNGYNYQREHQRRCEHFFGGKQEKRSHRLYFCRDTRLLEVLMAESIPELFGSNVFNDGVMKQRLPKDTYKALKKCRHINPMHL